MTDSPALRCLTFSGCECRFVAFQWIWDYWFTCTSVSDLSRLWVSIFGVPMSLRELNHLHFGESYLQYVSVDFWRSNEFENTNTPTYDFCREWVFSDAPISSKFLNHQRRLISTGSEHWFRTLQLAWEDWLICTLVFCLYSMWVSISGDQMSLRELNHLLIGLQSSIGCKCWFRAFYWVSESWTTVTWTSLFLLKK